MIFDKEKREQAKAREANIDGTVPVLTRDYIRALENVAIAAKHYHHNSTPVNGMHLYDALQKVDWMEE